MFPSDEKLNRHLDKKDIEYINNLPENEMYAEVLKTLPRLNIFSDIIGPRFGPHKSL